MNELIEILKNNPEKGYGYIFDNYRILTKSELGYLAKELIYTLENTLSTKDFEKACVDVANELEDSFF